MKDKEKKQDQTITSAGEVELTEEELDQVAGGFTWLDNKGKRIDGVGEIKPNDPDAYLKSK